MGKSTSDKSPAEQVGMALRSRDQTLATAESCTGGLISSLITNIPGSSDYFDRGIVSYSYDSKRELLAVSRESLDEFGAVSAQVAVEMASGVRDISGTTWGLSTTGIAGPSGGTPDSPVGTTFIGIAYAGPWGTRTSNTTTEHYEFEGNRIENKKMIARTALTDLLQTINSYDD